MQRDKTQCSKMHIVIKYMGNLINLDHDIMDLKDHKLPTGNHFVRYKYVLNALNI